MDIAATSAKQPGACQAAALTCTTDKTDVLRHGGVFKLQDPEVLSPSTESLLKTKRSFKKDGALGEEGAHKRSALGGEHRIVRQHRRDARRAARAPPRRAVQAPALHRPQGSMIGLASRNAAILCDGLLSGLT